VDERTVEATEVFQNINLDPDVSGTGSVTVRLSYEVGKAETTLTRTFAVEVRAPDGTLELQREFPSDGIRLEHEPSASAGTPAATPAA
jgi:hypothetical protein